MWLATFMTLLDEHYPLGGFNLPFEKYKFVSWDYEIPNRMKTKFVFQTMNHLFANHHLPLSIGIKHPITMEITMGFSSWFKHSASPHLAGDSVSLQWGGPQ